MPAVIVVGVQWGDEGKGKIVDLLTSSAKHVVRSQGGNNAGHTVIIGTQEFKLHLIPSGILSPHTICYIGAGCVIDPTVLLQEIEMLHQQGISLKNRLFISEGAHIIFPYHKIIDTALENTRVGTKIGTTGRGIGPCYADKINRLGIRMGEFVRDDLFQDALKNALMIKNREIEKLYGQNPLSFEEIFTLYSPIAQTLRPLVKKIEPQIFEAIKNNENLLFEAAQGTFLDITHGTYPFVTSSNTTASGVLAAAGIGPTTIDHSLGVVKAYTTRVGNGPFPTEMASEELFDDFSKARELGTTTGRKRRVGWFDVPLVLESIRLNGLDSLAITKLDILDHLDEIKICVGYEIDGVRKDFLPTVADDYRKLKPVYQTVKGWKCSLSDVQSYDELPKESKNYLKTLESLLKIPISMISLGPQRERSLILQDPFNKG